MGANIKVVNVNKAFCENEVSRISRNFFKGKNLDFKYFNSCDHGTYLTGGSAPVHVHQDLEEIFYFIRGTGVVILNGEEIKVKAGSVVAIPPGVTHGIRNTGKDILQNIVCSAIVNREE